MEKDKFTRHLKKYSKKLIEAVGGYEKRSFSERRTGEPHLPMEFDHDRRVGDDRRLSGSNKRTVFYYPL